MLVNHSKDVTSITNLLVPLQAIGATFAAMIGAGMLVRSISYEHSPMPKHLAWMLHAGLEGNIFFDCFFFSLHYHFLTFVYSNYKVNCVRFFLLIPLLSGVMGAVIAPLTLLGGPLMIRAAWYTAGIVGGLSTVAMCAPSEKFLNMGGPLAVGFGVVFASSLG